MNFDKIISTIKAEAERLGVTDYELYYMSEESLSVETLKDEISGFASGVSGGLSFRCSINSRMGYASTELLDTAEVEGLVSRAVENAKNTEKEDTVGIFAGSPSYESVNCPAYSPADAASLKALALDIQSAVYSASDKIADGTQSAAVSASLVIRLYNSHGLSLENTTGVGIAYAMPVVRDGEESQENFEMSELTSDLSPADIAKKAVDKALAKLGSSEIPTGKYNVIIDAPSMRSILSAFSSAFSAKNAQLGLSLLAGKEGEAVASEAVTITDDPMRVGVSMQTPFDAEGVAAHRKAVVEKGVLKTLLHNLETAKKAGVESTGNASRGGYSSPIGISPYAFCIEAGDYSHDGLLELAADGVYITEVKGLHAGANAVTGDFSIESAGFLIENGKLTRPVKSFTVAGNFFDLLKNIDALSDTVEVGIGGSFTRFGSPDVLIRNMSIAGV